MAVDRARTTAEALVAPVEVTGRVILDLRDDARPAADDEFVVDWQISDPPSTAVPGVPSPA